MTVDLATSPLARSDKNMRAQSEDTAFNQFLHQRILREWNDGTIARIQNLTVQLCKAVVFLLLAIAGEQNVLADTRKTDSSIVEIRDKVTDTTGEPIADASVAAIGLPFSKTYLPLRITSPGRIETTTEMDGSYRIEISTSDQRFLQSKELMLTVTSKDRLFQVRKIANQRCITGLPIDIELRPTTNQRLRVVSSESIPISGVTISPAQWMSVCIPYGATEVVTEPTGIDGTTAMPFAPRTGLEKVFATSPEIGNQCLDVGLGPNGMLQAIALPTDLEYGRLTNATAIPDSIKNLSLTLVTMANDAETTDYVWCDVDVGQDLTFGPCRLSSGRLQFLRHFPRSFPYAFDRSLPFNYKRPDPGSLIELPLSSATHVTGQLIDAQTGAPIPNVFVHNSDMSGASCFSDRHGKFDFWAGTGTIGYYPSDAWKKSVSPDSGEIRTNQVPAGGILDLQPLQLQPASTAVGIVRNESGDPVPGAAITCEFSLDSFTVTEVLFSGSDGRFRFYGIRPDTPVSLTASSDSRMTESPVRAKLADDTEIELVVHPHTAIQIRGRIVNSDAAPVANAIVRIRHPNVFEDHPYAGRGAIAEDLFDIGTQLMTDIDGHFASSPIMEWDQEISLAVDATGYLPLRTYWVDASDAGNSGSDLDLGTHTMLEEASIESNSIRVVDDQTGDPISAARVLCLGALSGRSDALASEVGLAKLSVSDGIQVLAAAADGYRPEFEIITSIADVDVIRLKKPGTPLPKRWPVLHDQTDLRTAAMRLLQLLPPPQLTDSVHCQRLYLQSLAFTDFDAAIQFAFATDLENAASERRLQDLLMLSWLSAEQIERLLPRVKGEIRPYLLLRQAKLLKSNEMRENKIGEAIVLLNQLSGNAHLYATSRTVDALLGIGEVEFAKELLSIVWDNHPELSSILEAETRKVETGVARTFAPAFALIDLEKSLRLIDQIALPGEIEQLRAKAMVYVAAYDSDQWNRFKLRSGVDGVPSIGMRQFSGIFDTGTFRNGRALLSQLKPSGDKATYLLELAQRGLDGSDGERTEVANEALDLLRTSELSSEIRGLSKKLASAAAQVAPWNPELAEELVFEAMWHCEGSHTILPYDMTSTLALELAPYDREIATAFVRPCFDDWSWLFGENDFDVIFHDNRPLAAAACIDPSWSMQLVDELFEKHLEGQQQRRYSTVASIIEKMSRLATKSE